MIINDVVARKEYFAAGSTTDFAFPFAILDEDDIHVMLNGAVQVINVDYTIPTDSVANQLGGTVHFLVAPTGTVILTRRQPHDQRSHYQRGEAFPALRVENDLTKLAMIAQEHREISNRAFKLEKKSLLVMQEILEPTAVDLFLRIVSLSPLTIGWGTLATLAGAIGVPVAFANGGTGSSFANANELAEGLKLARSEQISLTPSANILTLPDPLTGNSILVQAGNFNQITTSPPNGTVLVLTYAVGGNVLTDGAAGLQLESRQNYTTAAGDRSVFIRADTNWIELLRIPLHALGNATKFRRGDGTYQALPTQTLKAGVGQGLLISNSAVDANNDITIGIGDGVSDEADPSVRVSMFLSTALTKQLDAEWVAGDNAGMRVAGQPLADGTWHIFLFRRSGGTIDVCASNVLTGFTLPDGGTNKLRIFSLVRVAGIRTFVYNGGRRVLWKSPTLFFDANITATASTFEDTTNGSVPKGIPVDWHMMTTGSAVNGYIYPSPLDAVDLAVAAATAIAKIGTQSSGGEGAVAAAQVIVERTNLLGQIRMRASGTKNLKVATLGYDDVTLLR